MAAAMVRPMALMVTSPEVAACESAMPVASPSMSPPVPVLTPKSAGLRSATVDMAVSEAIVMSVVPRVLLARVIKPGASALVPARLSLAAAA